MLVKVGPSQLKPSVVRAMAGGGVGARRAPLMATAALVAVAALADQPPAPLVRASSCGSLGCSWAVSVWSDGAVEVTNHRFPHRGGRYRLSRAELQGVAELLRRERPWELTGALGDLVVDGPQRAVASRDGKRGGSFRLFSTPPGFAQIYLTDSSGLGRAIRVCEGVRALARDASLPSCVDRR